MDIRVEYSGAACILLALLCLVLPLDWLLSAAIAAVFHEICHILAVMVMGSKVYTLSIGTGGAVMEASPMESWKDLVCVLAGPAGSLSMLVLSAYIPKTALCGLVQGLFNLIPVYPLDGGRALACLTEMLFAPEMSAKICDYVRRTVLFLVVATGIYSTFAAKLGLLPILAAVFFLSRVMDGKISCKQGKLGVQ